MSTTEARLSLADAEVLADEVVQLLGESCAHIEVAGSIRRRAETVGDIEICAIPHTHEIVEPSLDLWSPRTLLVNDLEQRCADLIADGTFSKRLDKNGRAAVGAKYKRLSYRGFGLDLFITTTEQWGVIYLIRSGPSDYSHRLVTSTRDGGLMPAWLQVRNGSLMRRDTGEVIPTPTETDFYREIGQPFVAPEARR